jgi:hypothetical protein
MEVDTEETNDISLFYELPAEIHPLILSQLDVYSIGPAFCACKLWASFSTERFFRDLCVHRMGWSEKFLPENKSWKWVIQSKNPLGPAVEDSDEKISGLGCRVEFFCFIFVVYFPQWKLAREMESCACFWAGFAKGKLTRFSELPRFLVVVFTKGIGKILKGMEWVRFDFLAPPRLDSFSSPSS